MATVLFEGVFYQILLKTAKNDRFETLFQLCASPSPTFGGQLDFFNFPAISYLSNLDQQKCGWFWLILNRVMLKKPWGGHLRTGSEGLIYLTLDV